MAITVILDHDDPRYPAVTAFVARVFCEDYFARPSSFPRRLFARYDDGGHLVAAAGLRTVADGFFSEHYLDLPVERALALAAGRPVARADVSEVSTLVSRAARETGAFIDDIAATIADLGFRWSFFTLTHRLSTLLRRKGLTPIDLAPADPRRVPSPDIWGRYYLTSPRVFAVSIEHLGARAPFIGGRHDRAIAI